MNTDKMLDMSKVLKQKKEYGKLRETIEGQRDEILRNITAEYDIDGALDKYSAEEIENMSFSKMKEVFVTSEGNFIFDENEFPEKMMMDFIIYLKHSRETFKKMDEELEKLDQSMEEFNKEIKSITGETSFNKTLRASIESDLAQEGISEDKKARCEELLAAMDDAMTLRPLFELYEKVSPANTLRELKIESQRISVLKGYVRVCKENGLEPKLLKFGELEKVFLDEKYHVHKNLFIFILARYIKYMDTNLKQLRHRTFVIQLTNYIMEVVLGEEHPHYQADIKEIETLKMNIANLLDKFYN